MLKKGMVIKLSDKHVVVATDNSEFLRIKRRNGLEIGHQIYFDEKDIIQIRRQISKATFKTRSIYGSVLAACLLIIAIFINPLNIGNLPVYAVVSLDVNPSFEIQIDKDLRVLTIRAVNDDGLSIVDKLLVGMNLDDAVKKTIIDVEESGITITDKSGILISTVIIDEDDSDKRNQVIRVEKEIIEGLDKAFDQVPRFEQVKVIFLEADEEDLEEAKKENLSVGKYKLIQMSDSNESKEKLKEETVGELIQRDDIIEEIISDENNIVIQGKDINEINELSDEDIGETIDQDRRHWLEDYKIDDEDIIEYLKEAHDDNDLEETFEDDQKEALEDDQDGDLEENIEGEDLEEDVEGEDLEDEDLEEDVEDEDLEEDVEDEDLEEDVEDEDLEEDVEDEDPEEDIEDEDLEEDVEDEDPEEDIEDEEPEDE